MAVHIGKQVYVEVYGTEPYVGGQVATQALLGSP